ncbi:unnamed protein product [[Candida] boidinii]|nr:unnamed protein product [[Candida] boidinii]
MTGRHIPKPKLSENRMSYSSLTSSNNSNGYSPTNNNNNNNNLSSSNMRKQTPIGHAKVRLPTGPSSHSGNPSILGNLNNSNSNSNSNDNNNNTNHTHNLNPHSNQHSHLHSHQQHQINKPVKDDLSINNFSSRRFSSNSRSSPQPSSNNNSNSLNSKTDTNRSKLNQTHKSDREKRDREHDRERERDKERERERERDRDRDRERDRERERESDREKRVKSNDIHSLNTNGNKDRSKPPVALNLEEYLDRKSLPPLIDPDLPPWVINKFEQCDNRSEHEIDESSTGLPHSPSSSSFSSSLSSVSSSSTSSSHSSIHSISEQPNEFTKYNGSNHFTLKQNKLGNKSVTVTLSMNKKSLICWIRNIKFRYVKCLHTIIINYLSQ